MADRPATRRRSAGPQSPPKIAKHKRGGEAELGTPQTRLHNQRAVLDDLFKALLHKLITGNIRVDDLDLPNKLRVSL